MKLIQGETILSIIHGPGTESHIAELSLFLRRQINVWFKNEYEVWLFGRDFHRQPRISLEYWREKRHFALVDGSEPRNCDDACGSSSCSGGHRHNCAFDVISDQTGYPAADLRDIAARRILVKVYQARLLGKDYVFEDEISGGASISVRSIHDAKQLLDWSVTARNGHPRSHVERKSCGCDNLGRVNCIKCFSRTGFKSGFKSDHDQDETLWKQLERDGGAGVMDSLRYSHTYPMLSDIYSLGLRKVGVAYNMERKTADDFYIGAVKTVFRDASDPYIVTMYPVYNNIHAMSRNSQRSRGSR
ncbi:hypothetical protein TKK_0012669 [Trichogramma kaykai]